MSEEKQEYSREELKQIWISGKYKSRPQMAEALGYTHGQLKYYSKLDKWSDMRTKALPRIEEKALARIVDREAVKLAKIHGDIVDLQEILLTEVKATIRRNKGKMTMEDALKAAKMIAELQNKVLSPYQRALLNPQHAAPTGEGPGSAAVGGGTQFNLNVNVGNGQVQLDTPTDKRLEDEDLERIIRDAQGIILDEQPAATATAQPGPAQAPKAKSSRSRKGATAPATKPPDGR